MLNVERAGLPDIDRLVELRLQYLKEDRGQLKEEETAVITDRLPAYFQRVLDRELFVFVIREGGDIVSCAFLLVTEKPMSPAFLNGKTGTVLNVYTEPAFRHRGYAKEIMEKLVQKAEELELAYVELQATEDGYPLYKKTGFKDEMTKYRRMRWTNEAGKPADIV